MEFYTDDKRDYTPIIENWVYKFVSSMEEIFFYHMLVLILILEEVHSFI